MNRTIRILIVIALTSPALLTAGVAFLASGTDSFSELALFLPYYWFVPPLVAATLLLWRLGWWPPVIVALGWLALLFPIAGLRWTSPSAPPSDARLIKVMTFNTKAFKVGRGSGGIDLLEAEIRGYKADIIALQDADGMLPGVPSGTPVRMGPYLGYTDVYAVGQYIVASRFPIKDCASADLGPNKRSRNFMYCTILVHERPVTLVTAHLKSPRYSFLSVRDAPRSGLSEWESNMEDRFEEAGRLADKVATLPRPLLLVGDFNAREESEVVQTISASGLTDVFSEAGRGTGFSYGHSVHLHRDFLRIDHILASTDVQVYSARAGTSMVSDHHPVLAEIWLPPGSAAPPRGKEM